MPRAVLTGRQRIGRDAAPYAAFVPAVTVVAASLLAALPIISTSGWYPDFGYLVLISWRLLRADPWPAWWAAPLGLVNDLFELSQKFNSFFHKYPVLKESDETERRRRLACIEIFRRTMRGTLELLGIPVPERM